MKTLSPENERRILSAVKLATQAIDEDGLTPSQAVVKAARAQDLGPTMLPLLVHALNTGRQTYQRKSASLLLDKLATFPLASLDEVHELLYPEKVASHRELLQQSAVSPEYNEPPRPLPKPTELTKAAASLADLPGTLPKVDPYQRDPDSVIKHALHQADGIKRASQRTRAAFQEADDAFQSAMGQVAEYFWQAPIDRISLAECEHNTGLMFGKLGAAIINYVCDHNANTGRVEKRASQVPYQNLPVDRSAEPYSLIATAIKRAGALLEVQREWETKRAEASRQINQLVDPYDHVPQYGQINILTGKPRELAKSAGSLGNMIAASLGGGLGAGFQQTQRGASGQSPEDLVNSAERSLFDPGHENELRAIDAKAQLSDFMANDEVIKHYDPQQVLRVYNEIARVSPNASTQPAIMRPLLRRQLAQGSTEPHEVEQLANVESKLQANAGPRPGVKPQPQGGGNVGKSQLA